MLNASRPAAAAVFWRAGLLAFFLLSAAAMALAETAPLKTLSGRVHHTDVSRELLLLDFTHPATGVQKQMAFRVTHETGLNGFRALPDMQTSDIVTVDYHELPDGELKAVYVAKFRISGPPSGMENFKGL